MKKILSLIVSFAAVTMFTACGDDDATYTATPQLEIETADILFEADGGTGSIVVNTTDEITATTSSSWLSLSVSGNTVNVTAASLTDLYGRSGKIIINAGGKQAQVVATQNGLVFGIEGDKDLLVSDAEQTIGITAKASLKEIQLTNNADWLTAQWDYTNQQIKLTVAKNETGNPRIDTVAVNCVGILDTIIVVQAEMAKDLVGNYFYCGYVLTSNGYEFSYLPASCSLTGTNFAIEFPAYGWKLAATANTSSLSLSLANAQSMGTYTSGDDTFYIYNIVGDSQSGYINRGTAITVTGSFAFGEEDGDIWAECDLEDDGSWTASSGTRHVNYIRFDEYKADSPTAANYAGYLLRFFYPALLRYNAYNTASTTGAKGMGGNSLKSELEKRYLKRHKAPALPPSID